MTSTARRQTGIEQDRTRTLPERHAPAAPPAVASETRPRIAVAGMAIAETVRHGALGERRGIGGVAGNMAEALAWAGNRVTMVTMAGAGPHGEEVARLLAERGIRPETTADRRPAGHAVIGTRNGEQGRARGSWPMPSGLWRILDRLDGEYDAVASDAHMSREDLQRILNRPGLTTMVNGTSTRSAVKLLQTRIPGLTMACMNRPELEAVHGLIPVHALSRRMNPGSPQEAVRRELNAALLLTTRGAQGWSLHGPDGPVSSRAVAVPERTDFVGCGDWAAAGALHAQLHGADPVQTINDFIEQKLRNNVV